MCKTTEAVLTSKFYVESVFPHQHTMHTGHWDYVKYIQPFTCQGEKSLFMCSLFYVIVLFCLFSCYYIKDAHLKS